MKPLHRHLLVAGLATSLGIAAIAAVAQSQTPPAAEAPQPSARERLAGDPSKGEHRRERMHGKIERKLGQFKQKLQITPAQEPAWTAWAGAVRPGATMRRPSRQDMAALSTPERIDRMIAVRAQRNAEMDKRLDATKTFYGTLSADQQKVFDAESLRFAQRHGGKRGFSHRG